MLKHQETYEIIRPETVGVISSLVMVCSGAARLVNVPRMHHVDIISPLSSVDFRWLLAIILRFVPSRYFSCGLQFPNAEQTIIRLQIA